MLKSPYFTLALVFIAKYSYEKEVTQASSFLSCFGGVTETMKPTKAAYSPLYFQFPAFSSLYFLPAPTPFSL